MIVDEPTHRDGNMLGLLDLVITAETSTDSADEFADQLEQSVVSVLDELAPLKICSKRCGRWSNRWLSESAVTAKRKRRRLERRWYRTRRQADHVVYCSACHEANAEIP